MLDKDKAANASRILFQHWRDGTKLDALEARLRPQSRTEGYAVQAGLETLSRGKLFGWKIAATSVSGQTHINVTGPLAGRIMSDTVIADGGTASMKGNEMRVGEPEFAFRMGRDLPPRAAPYTVDEVLAAVESFHPAIEIPDSRFGDFASAGEAQLIADNACAHLFVLGTATTANWRAMDLVEERPAITLRGQRYIGHGKNVLGDPRAALAWLANELRGLGITLRAGEVVTTGTCHPPLPIQAGDHFAVDFGVLGKVSVGFV
ncbi:fumarylacetoacetate hydrolase family protein [Bradyrhizobium sp. 141]|uniref:2-keto-4-pentenoate hydratase n=1 Tax=Bradyrhizobium sp. 141 TaxID=2782617 RepID=UPI001FFBE470|nr:fumarylacetoacetate hydrolase family protein [Bradyrhizobium sp. 141]MCK1719686.1 hydratase [Bradyrhizobium sp. 141]